MTVKTCLCCVDSAKVSLTKINSPIYLTLSHPKLTMILKTGAITSFFTRQVLL